MSLGGELERAITASRERELAKDMKDARERSRTRRRHRRGGVPAAVQPLESVPVRGDARSPRLPVPPRR